MKLSRGVIGLCLVLSSVALAQDTTVDYYHPKGVPTSLVYDLRFRLCSIKSVEARVPLGSPSNQNLTIFCTRGQDRTTVAVRPLTSSDHDIHLLVVPDGNLTIASSTKVDVLIASVIQTSTSIDVERVEHHAIEKPTDGQLFIAQPQILSAPGQEFQLLDVYSLGPKHERVSQFHLSYRIDPSTK